MSLILFTCVAAGAATFGWVSGRRARERHEQTVAARTITSQPAPNPFAAFPCGLKDVLARTPNDEALLTGGFRLSEAGSPIAAIFLAVGAPGVSRVVVSYPGTSTDALWLSVDSDITIGTDPPGTLSVQGAVLERTRRIPVVVERFGVDLPDVDREATLAEYRGGTGQAAIILRGPKHTLIAAGDAVTFASLERYPGS